MSKNRLLVALAAWVAVTCIVWALFVPRGLSVGTFALLTLSGLFLLAAGSMLLRALQPAQSVGHSWVKAPAEATDGHGRA